AGIAQLRLPVLHPRRLSDRHHVQPRRLPRGVHHLLSADRARLLPADAVRHQHGQGGAVHRSPPGLRRRRGRRPGRPAAVPLVAEELSPGACSPCPGAVTAAGTSTERATSPRTRLCPTDHGWAEASVSRCPFCGLPGTEAEEDSSSRPTLLPDPAPPATLKDPPRTPSEDRVED